jgi:1-phosphatidylinositol phosphodiesterase
MKRKGVLIFGALLAALVIGIVLIGCGEDSTPESTPHSVKITGIPAEYDHDRASIVLFDDNPGMVGDKIDAIVVAQGRGLISGDSATIELKTPNGADWDGSGPHHLQLSLDRTTHHADGIFFIYTDSKTFEDLGITEDDSIEDIDSKLPTWHIDGTESEIPFTAFDFFHELPEMKTEPDGSSTTSLFFSDSANWVKILASKAPSKPNVQPVPPYAINTTNWMSGVPDSKSIKDMAIPGTHDSATFSFPDQGRIINEVIEEWAKCHYDSDNFRAQLNDGIRFFDIRVGPGGGGLTHGEINLLVTTIPIYTNQNLYDTIDVFIQFLREHPSETILVLLRNENGSSNYKSICAPAFSGSRASYWHLSEAIPTLGSVRGKMVLINSHDSGKTGIRFYDQIMQDFYNIGTWDQTPGTRAAAKAQFILGYIEVVRESDPFDRLFLNFWNHQANAFVPIRWYASEINDWMSRLMPKNTYPQGIQIMDYYWRDNVKRVIESPVNSLNRSVNFQNFQENFSLLDWSL